VSSVPAPTPVTVLGATPVARPATSATNATTVTDAPSGTSSGSASSLAKAKKCTPTTAHTQTGMKSPCPAAARTAADPGQGELHPDGDTVAAAGLPVVQDAGGRRTTKRLDPTGQGHERGDDAGHGERDAKPRTGVRLTPTEPHEAKEPLDERGQAQVTPGSRPTGPMLFHVVHQRSF
jgi:hypothetical protein